MKRSSAALGATGLVTLALGGAWIATTRPPWAIFGKAAAPAADRAGASWTTAELQDLVGAIRAAGREGLRPGDYRLDDLASAIAAGRTGAAVDALAAAAAASLAHDYAAGRVVNRHRFNWYVDHAGPDAAALTAQLAAARAQGRLAVWLTGLLPTSADYRALRDALAATPASDEARRNRIIANMERWRWLPRDFGHGDQLYVNLPTYQLEVIADGAVVERHRVVIGALDMPTPVLSAPVRQVIANPDWIVPASIVRRSNLRPGSSSRYTFTTRPGGGLRVRQKPGPGNALGRVKIEFPNRLAIYFHDTPSKSLFGANTRAFSHGCVRVQDIDALATSLVARPDRFTAALAGDKTRSFAPAHGWQANIVYLTLVAAADGAVTDVGDPYHMDEALAAALQGRRPRRPAPAPILPVAPPSRPHPGPAPTAAPLAPLAPLARPAPEPIPDDTQAPAPTVGNQQ